ncbi:hypothetical protein Q7P37_001397 [Cladosporium fusiforme]
MAKPKVLLLGEIEHAHAAWTDLSTIAEIITPTSTNRADFLQECASGSFENVKVAYRTFASASITGLWDPELISALPSSLAFCAHNGAGYDQIDIQACSARSPPLRVSNVPTAVDDATADTAVFLLLGALKNLNSAMFALRRGEWKGQPAPSLGRDPQGKVLGILGMGGIGRNMMRKCEVFGMTTIYHNRRKLTDEQAGGAMWVEFGELLARADVLSLNLPLNTNTHHIISTAEFAQMKNGVVIVNTARGAVMDEAALVQALKSGQVSSVGLDVFEDEPRVHPGLLENPNVMLLPHMGTYTVETMEKMERWCIGNVREALEKGALRSPVPEQADL